MALKDANENPWYILMTLHGEQEGEEIDWELDEKNRKLWNAWSCQGLSLEVRTKLAKSSKIDIEETEWTGEIAQEVQSCFTAEFLARNPDHASAPDIPKSGARIDLHAIKFCNPIAFNHLIFTASADFSSASFTGAANFIAATFTGFADFESATFTSVANFLSATFTSDADFTSVTFTSVTFPGAAVFTFVTFRGAAKFSSATFTGAADFTSATFTGYAAFISATFTGDAKFSAAMFTSAAAFVSATFTGDAYFYAATFTGDAYFGSATFTGDASFSFVTFKGMADFSTKPRYDEEKDLFVAFGRKTDFSNAHFKKRSDFHNCRFGPYEGRAEELTFANAIIDGPVSFEGAAFPHLLPVLTNASLPPSTKVTAEPDHWPDPPGPLHWITRRLPAGWENPAQVKASAAALRHAMTRQTLPEEEHFFFRYEMNAAALIGGFWQRLPYGLFCLFSDFGYSIARPVNWLAGVYGLGVGALLGWFAESQNLLSALGLAAATSFANMLPVFGFQRVYLADVYKALPPALQFISGAQTVLAFVFLFFLGLGLRTRFRLK